MINLPVYVHNNIGGGVFTALPYAGNPVRRAQHIVFHRPVKMFALYAVLLQLRPDAAQTFDGLVFVIVAGLVSMYRRAPRLNVAALTAQDMPLGFGGLAVVSSKMVIAGA